MRRPNTGKITGTAGNLKPAQNNFLQPASNKQISHLYQQYLNNNQDTQQAYSAQFSGLQHPNPKGIVSSNGTELGQQSNTNLEVQNTNYNSSFEFASQPLKAQQLKQNANNLPGNQPAQEQTLNIQRDNNAETTLDQDANVVI